MSSHTTNLNPASPNSINGTMNSSPIHLSSNFSNNNGSMSSTWIAPNSTPEVHQNDLILQKSSSTADPHQIALSQVGHSRGLTEVRRTCISAQGVQIFSVVSHPSVQNHSVSYKSKIITVTEVTRTTNLNSPPYTTKQILHHNGSATFQHQEPVGDSFNHMSNQLGQSNSVQPRLTFDNKPISLHATGSVDSDSMQNILGSHSQMVKMDLLTSNQKIDPKLEYTDVKGKQSEDPYDGITHSFPHRKHGPYTCPRCRKVYDRSQTFAAHMNVHYKTESPAERKRRQAAKYKHRDLRKIGANMRKGTADPQTHLSLAVKVKEGVENP